jgi:hypothetical protein
MGDRIEMRHHRTVYVAAIFIAGAAGGLSTIIAPDNEPALVVLSQVTLAVLTFPLGFVATAIGFFLVFMGYTTTTEAIFAMTPAHALLGYIQWYRLVPAIYRSAG